MRVWLAAVAGFVVLLTGGAATAQIDVRDADADMFLIRCDMTGAYLSRDGGDSFTQINYPNGSYSFAFDPMDPDIIYIGSNALNRSSNGGEPTLNSSHDD